MPKVREITTYTLEELKNEKPDSYKIAKEETIQHALKYNFDVTANELSQSVSGFHKMLELSLIHI